MKKLILMMMLIAPICASAQGLSSMTGNNDKKLAPVKEVDKKYLEGAVPVVNGRVTFTHEFTYRCSDTEALDKAKEWALGMKDECISNQIVFESAENNMFVLRNEHYLIFKNQTFALDRTRINYHLYITAKDGKCNVEMTKINYWYEEQRDGGIHYTAEEWITDENGLNRKKDKLAKVSGKFRMKTIDLKDMLFKELEEKLM